jgi:hypothetical protein
MQKRKFKVLGKTSDGSVPTDQAKYRSAKASCDKKMGKKTSAYKSMCIVRKYKDNGGSYR